MISALTWTPLAFVLAVVVHKIWVLTNLPDRLGESHLPEIVGKGMWPATITAVGALAYYGGIASGIFGGGASTAKAPIPPAGGAAIAGPTLTALGSFASGDSFKVVVEDFDTAGNGTYDSLHVQADTFGGGFGTPQYRDTVLGPLSVDTVPMVGDSGADFTVRARQKIGGTWSNWTTIDSVRLRSAHFWMDWGVYGPATDSMWKDETAMRGGTTAGSNVWGQQSTFTQCLTAISAGITEDICGAKWSEAQEGRWPAGMMNVYKIGYWATGDSAGHTSVSFEQPHAEPWPSLSVGDALFHRVYYSMQIDNIPGDSSLKSGGNHPYEGRGNGTDYGGGANCANHWEHKYTGIDTNNDYTWSVHVNQNSPQQGNYAGLFRDSVYNMETRYYKVGVDSFVVDARLDEADASTTMGGPLGGDTVLIDEVCLTTLYIGNNGPGGNWAINNGRGHNFWIWNLDGPFPWQDWQLWGGVAVYVSSDSTEWIGAFDEFSATGSN